MINLKILLFGIIFFSAPVYGKICSMSSVGFDQYHLNIGSRQIQIIGWSHLDPKDGQDVLIEALNGIAQLENTTCDVLEVEFNKIILDYQSNIESSQNVVDSILQASKNFNINKLGSEHSYYTAKYENEAALSYLKFFDQVRSQCHLNNQMDKLELLIPGPLSFYKRHHDASTEIEGVESHYLKNKFGYDFEWMSLEPNWSLYTPEVLAEVDKLDESSTDEDILKVSHMVEGPIIREELKRYLFTVKSFLDNSIARSFAIARNVFNRPGNYVVLIGRSHAKDIAESLIQRCRKL